MGRDRAAQADLNERRLWVPPELELGRGERVVLGQEAAKHARVCRLSSGDMVEVFDGAGRRAPARVVDAEARRLTLELTALAERVERGPLLSLVLCVPRAGKLDDIVRMTTELGLCSLHLALSDFSVGTAARADAKLERLTRVAREALRQSEGAYLPELHAPAPLFEVVAGIPKGAQRAVLVARGGHAFFLPPGAQEAWLVVGPEGGLSEGEEARLLEMGFSGLSLGPQVLRVQTAAVCATALALHQMRGP